MTDDDPAFTPGLFSFLRDLRENNEREWFNANKARFEAEVKEPALAFVEDFELLLDQVSPHFKGKLFRIYRDTRFGRDKTPYKTHTGIHFRHERAEGAHSLGYYLHLEPDNPFMGVGVWRPEGATLKAIREAIAARPAKWREAVAALGEDFVLEGTALKRPPAGFDATHPQIDDIKRKDFVAMRRLTEKAVTAPGFLRDFQGLCRDASPFMRFLCAAAGEPF